MFDMDDLKQYVLNTADEVQKIIDTLEDDERVQLGGEPGTPYMSSDEEDDIAKRFIAKDADGCATGFLDLCWASSNALSAVVAVRKDARGAGYADALVEEIVSWLDKSDEAREMGIEKINWFARRDNPASLYLATKHGFFERDDYRRDGEWWGGVRWRREDSKNDKAGNGEEKEETTPLDEQHYEIDHADIVTTHICNKRCEFCIDALVNSSREIVSMADVRKFLELIDSYNGGKKITVLLLGGEPTVLPKETLIEITEIIHSFGYKASMSTNGLRREFIIDIAPYFDSIQITFDDLEKLKEWQDIADKINVKICGDAGFTLDKLSMFKKMTQSFQRRSVTMYFTDDFHELCRNKEVWEYLDTLEWKRNGAYMYAFDDGVRFKKCIPGETNIIDEPTIPKLYPNGNYNRTWMHEELDDYMSPAGESWLDEK